MGNDKKIIVGKIPSKRKDKGNCHSCEGICETVTTEAGKGHSPIILEVKYEKNLLRNRPFEGQEGQGR